MFQRYALYFAPPPDSDLARLGAQWLGRDAQGGGVVMQPAPDLAGCRPLAALTASPRRYGLHATLKPPMRLADGVNADDLMETLSVWTARRAPVDLGAVQVAALGPFLALVPVVQPAALTQLAADLVRDFDRFRAPLSDADLARRRAHGLTPRQEELLTAWGYPHVMEEFRFHITLSDRLDPSEVAPVTAAVTDHLAPVLDAPLTVTQIAVFAEDDAGLFHALRRFDLRG